MLSFLWSSTSLVLTAVAVAATSDVETRLAKLELEVERLGTTLQNSIEEIKSEIRRQTNFGEEELIEGSSSSSSRRGMMTGGNIATFFFAAGLPNPNIVEVFQLGLGQQMADSSRICRKRADLPLVASDYGGLVHPVSRAFNDHLLVCGGSLHYENVASCREYNYSTNSWADSEVRLLEARYQATSIVMDDGSWWVLGGVGADGKRVNTTEIMAHGSKTFQQGPMLPAAVNEHCILRINETHHFLAYGTEAATRDSWLFEFASRTWHALPPTARYRNGRSVCGYAERRGFGGADAAPTREVVLGGGAAESFAERASEILDLDSLTWRQGPPLPERMSSALAVPWRKSFVILGGPNEIYEYVEELWWKREEKLRRKKPSYGAVLVQVPDHVC